MTKFILLLSATSLALASTAHAQLGLRAGGNLMRLSASSAGDDPSIGTGSHTSSQGGYQLGVSYQVRLGKRLAIVPEVQFSREQMQVATHNYSRADIEYKSDYRTHFSYLNVPVVLRATYGPVYLEAGLQASFLVGGHEAGTYTFLGNGFNSPSTSSIEEPIGQNYQRFDLGPCLGAAVQVAPGLHLSVRAYQGFLSTTREPDFSYHSYNDGMQKGMQRQNLQVSLAYQFPVRQPE